jgi:NADPH2:quinone reductase
MKAVWLTEFGGPEVLTVRDTPEPVPAPGQVLVAVAAASITFIETVVRAGTAPWPTGAPQPPYVPGNGVGGTVIEVGPGVDEAWLGERVVCTTGGTGGYAEQAVASVDALVRVPAELDLTTATALLADGRTATGLVEVAAPRPGEWALILAAAGGVGSLLVQLAAAAGARVIAAAGGDRKLAAVRDLGADRAVDYSDPSWTATLPPVDIVFDGVGGAIGTAALHALAPGGRFVQFGLSSGSPTKVERDDVTVIGFQALGALGARSVELTTKALANAGKGELRPLIGQTYALGDAAQAHRAIESRVTIGKTLLVP